MVYHLPVLPPELTGPAAGWSPKEGFSPSALSSYAGEDGCKRRWAWGALFGVWSLKKSIATLLGSLIHGSLEHYMRGGTVYDLNGPNGEIRVDARTWKEFQVMLDRGWLSKERLAELAAMAPARALAGIPYLPQMGEPGIEIIETEQWVDIDTTRVLGGVERIKINAKLDLRMRRVGIWYLYDHKSTKGKPRDPWCYVKTPEQLKKDPQAVFYALDLMLKHNLDGLWIRWVYYLTDQNAHPIATHVDVELSRQEVMEAAYQWLLVAHEMRGLVRAARAGTITPYDIVANVAVCDSYGGCTYHFSKGGPCMPEGEVNLGSVILTGKAPEKATDMGLAEAFAAEQANLTNGKSNGAAVLAPPPIPAGMPLVPPENAQAQAAAAQTATAPSLPPLPPGWHYFNGGPRQDAAPGMMYAEDGKTQVPIPPPPAPVVAPQTGPGSAETAGKGKRGRPKGSKNKAADDNTIVAPADVTDETADEVIDRVIQTVKENQDSALRTLTVEQLLELRAVV